MFPAASMAMPSGADSAALRAGPPSPEKPLVPFPAMVLITGREAAAAIVKEIVRVAVCLVVSVNVTANWKVPGAEGDPVIAPVEGFRVRPAGSAGEVLQVTAPVAPLAERV